MTREEVIASSPILSSVQELGQKYSHWGWAELSRPLTLNFYQTWIDSGFHADMEYLKNHLAQKTEPQRVLQSARTALVFAQKYHPFPQEEKLAPPLRVRSALYAQGRDYHHWFKQDLTRIATELGRKFPQHQFLAMTDSSPVMERDLARKAGLGWFGKNSCLIDRQEGSLFFIGEIYSDFSMLEIKAKETSPESGVGAADRDDEREGVASLNGMGLASPDFCGTCTKCIEICPTGALIKPKVLDANKCISYWTIESRGIAPPELRPHLQDWFFGCDLCQTICPWNQKHLRQHPIPTFTKDETEEDLRFILTASNQKLRNHFRDSAMNRAGPFGLRRNAIIVAVNLQLVGLRPVIKGLSRYEKLTDLCTWAEERLTSL